MHTTSFWLTLGHELLAELPFSLSERQSGIFGLLYALESMAALLLMCDRRDLGTAVGERPASPGVEPGGESPIQDNVEPEWQSVSGAAAIRELAEKEFFEPNLYIYDA